MAKVLWYEIVVAAVTDRGVAISYPGTVQHGEIHPVQQLQNGMRAIEKAIDTLEGEGMSYAEWRNRLRPHEEKE